MISSHDTTVHKSKLWNKVATTTTKTSSPIFTIYDRRRFGKRQEKKGNSNDNNWGPKITIEYSIEI